MKVDPSKTISYRQNASDASDPLFDLVMTIFLSFLAIAILVGLATIEYPWQKAARLQERVDYIALCQSAGNTPAECELKYKDLLLTRKAIARHAVVY